MSEENQSHLIARIILRVGCDIATEEERRVLEAWLRVGEERRALYERIVAGESLKAYLDAKADFDRSADYGKLQADILQTIRQRSRGRRIRRTWGWAAAAAAVLLVGVVAVREFVPEPGTPVALAVNQPDSVVQDKVVLVLSDGRQVGMSGMAGDSLQVGFMAMARTGEELLVYEKSLPGEIEVEEKELPEQPLEMNKVVTGTGGFYNLVLSDGTRVWLNSESELEYPVKFGRGEREVRLQGEAFFEVARDEARPFIVTAGDVRTRVLGTSFNVKAYADEDDVLATLFTGRVEVAPIRDLARRVVLSPGRQADWNARAGRMEVNEVELRRVAAWKEGRFVFNKEEIEVVTRQIERWYGVTFVYQLDGSSIYTFSGSFSRDESLESILSTFTVTGGPEFNIAKDSVYVTDPKK